MSKARKREITKAVAKVLGKFAFWREVQGEVFKNPPFFGLHCEPSCSGGPHGCHCE